MAAFLPNLASTFDPLLLPRKLPSRCPNLSTVASNFRHGTLSNPSFGRHFHRLPRTLAAVGGSGGTTRLGFGMGDTGLDYTRCSAVSDGGSGEGGYGGWGDGSSGGGGGRDESHGDGWSFLKWYLMALDKHPVITKSVTSALLTLIGDLICQLLIDHVLKLDVKRTLVFTFLGLVLVGPTLHFWYLSLSKLVTLPGATGSVLRLLLDQFVFSPIFIGVFLSALVTLEGKPSHVWPKLQQEWFSSVLANWQLWIPFQFLNFQFVPQKFQVLAANFVALAWNVILSFKAHKEVVLK